MKRPKHPPAPAPAKAPPTDWDRVADWYDALVGEAGSEYHREVVIPGVLRLAALAPGDSALDIACGQGVLCRILHQRGVRATGVDAAPELIRLARQRSITMRPSTPEAQNVPPPQYHIGDARRLDFLPPAEFTAATCVLAIQNIHPFQPVFETAARRLGANGRLVVVMMHPCFRGPKYTAWGWEDDKVQYRRVERYLLPRKEPIVTHPGQSPDKYTWTFHRPIGAYIKALRNAGLLVDAIEEWASHKTSAPGPRAAAENLARKEIPMFMAIRAVKTSGQGSVA